ncbi:MAG: DNA-directed RNA polymerase subunit delta [Bacillota bacterium]|nr:DNA-directed RNA polymerase subunit delta [Bacillota bacterium]
MKSISLPDTAFDILTKAGGAMSFKELYQTIAEMAEFDEDDFAHYIGHFYTDLSLDGRFVGLTDNRWDLRSRCTYEQVHISVADVYSDADEEEMDAEDLAEQREYDAAMTGSTLDQNSSETTDGEGFEAKGNESSDAAEALGIDK